MREAGSSPIDPNDLMRTVTAASLRFWARYAPPHQLDSAVAETIGECLETAERTGAVSGFEEGLRLGTKAVEYHRHRTRKPLTTEQLDQLFGPQRSHGCLQPVDQLTAA